MKLVSVNRALKELQNDILGESYQKCKPGVQS